MNSSFFYEKYEMNRIEVLSTLEKRIKERMSGPSQLKREQARKRRK